MKEDDVENNKHNIERDLILNANQICFSALSLKQLTSSRFDLLINFFHSKQHFFQTSFSSKTKPTPKKIRSIAILNKKKSFIGKGQLEVRQMHTKSRRRRRGGEENEEKRGRERKKETYRTRGMEQCHSPIRNHRHRENVKKKNWWR